MDVHHFYYQTCHKIGRELHHVGGEKSRYGLEPCARALSKLVSWYIMVNPFKYRIVYVDI
jgi:hypothetical protein